MAKRRIAYIMDKTCYFQYGRDIPDFCLSNYFLFQ